MAAFLNTVYPDMARACTTDQLLEMIGDDSR